VYGPGASRWTIEYLGDLLADTARKREMVVKHIVPLPNLKVYVSLLRGRITRSTHANKYIVL
jgi:hypothetical protein